MDMLYSYEALAISLIPAAALAIWFIGFIKKKDNTGRAMYDTALTFGMLSALLAFIVESVLGAVLDLIVNDSNSVLYSFLNAFTIAALCEESAKFFMGYRVINKYRSYVSRLDVIIIMCLSAVGFHVVESVIYAISNSTALEMLNRGWFTPVHVPIGLLMGLLLGDAIMQGKKMSPQTIMFPVLYHGIYDFLVFCSVNVESYLIVIPIYHLLLAGFICIILFIVFINRKRKDNSYTRPLF